MHREFSLIDNTLASFLKCYTKDCSLDMQEFGVCLLAASSAIIVAEAKTDKLKLSRYVAVVYIFIYCIEFALIWFVH